MLPSHRCFGRHFPAKGSGPSTSSVGLAHWLPWPPRKVPCAAALARRCVMAMPGASCISRHMQAGARTTSMLPGGCNTAAKRAVVCAGAGPGLHRRATLPRPVEPEHAAQSEHDWAARDTPAAPVDAGAWVGSVCACWMGRPPATGSWWLGRQLPHAQLLLPGWTVITGESVSDNGVNQIRGSSAGLQTTMAGGACESSIHPTKPACSCCCAP